VALGFLAGSLPFSVWIGRSFLKRDIRTVGDHNPGATNVLRAGSKPLAALALLLDMAKGALPVGAAYSGNIGASPWLIAVALAPVLGHAYSPFLRWHGGKAVAVSGGIWTGLTAWEGPTVGGIGLAAGNALFGANGWAVMFSMAAMLLYFLLVPPGFNGLVARPPLPLLVTIWLGNTVILAWTHRADLARAPKLLPGRRD
jgi:glycerol-3-phosphate acyltransferase PlsY